MLHVNEPRPQRILFACLLPFPTASDLACPNSMATGASGEITDCFLRKALRMGVLRQNPP